MTIDDLTDDWLVTHTNFVIAEMALPPHYIEDCRQAGYLAAFALRSRLQKRRDAEPDFGKNLSGRKIEITIKRDVYKAVGNELCHTHAPENAHYKPAKSEEYAAERIGLSEALLALCPDDRAMLSMRYTEKLKWRDIAGAFGVGISTIEYRVNRAVKRLRVLMGGDDEETNCDDGVDGDGVRINAHRTGPNIGARRQRRRQ